MRLAISAVAATTGLLLLGLAFYGQPALYFQQAKDSWNAVFEVPLLQQPEPDRAAADERVAQLQQQVAGLEEKLAATQVQPPQPVAPAPIPVLPRPPAEPDHAAADQRVVQLQQQLARLEEKLAAAPLPPPQPVALAPAPLILHQPEAEQPEQLATTRIAPHQSDAPRPEIAQPEPMRPTRSEPTRLESPRPELLHLEPPLPRVTVPSTDVVPPATTNPDRHVAAAFDASAAKSGSSALNPPKPEPITAEPAKSEPTRSEPTRSEPTRSDASRLEPPRSTPARPVTPKLALVKPPAPPPLPQPSPPRQDTDGAQSVLARLRQSAPVSQPVQPPDVPPPPAQPPPRAPLSPSLPRLASARAALANGQVEDARRLLQEAQLQLVFRPVNAVGDDQPSFGKGAADVAHALEALSANDIPRSRRYIDIARDDLSGATTNSSVQETNTRTTGYAPAYPPR